MLEYVVVKVPDKGDVSKSARFFQGLSEAIDYAEDGPYDSMIVARVLQDNWFDRLLVKLVQFINPARSDGKEVSTVS